jgi:LemA protein
MKTVIAITVIVLFVIIVVVWILSTYNRLVSERLKVQTQWKQIDVVLKQRADLIPNLVEAVKGYVSHEKEALQAVTDARSRYMGSLDQDAQIQASNSLSGALGRLMAVAESYPELKANQSYLDLQQQMGGLENKIADFRQFYNDMVMRYNRLLVTIPSNIVAGMFKFCEASFYEAEEADKAMPKVKFR